MTAVEREFRPARWLSNPHLQTMLPSTQPLLGLTRRRARTLLGGHGELLLECGAGVRLQAFHVPAPRPRRRLAVLLHGWEGHVESPYVLSLGALLLERGYDVLRFHLRDHGKTHALNQELFHSCRLPEVVGAVRDIAARFADWPLYLAGFSLGGNFLLRVVADPGAQGLPIRRVVAVSPVLSPVATLAALEEGPAMYRWYFVRRWSKSLRIKQRVWPDIHGYEDLLRTRDLRRMTAGLVERCTDFPHIDDYLNGYAITGGVLDTLHAPATLLAAADDPIIPAGDLVQLSRGAPLQVVLTAHGGHCGFIDRPGRPSFADRFALAEFERSG
ncbi:MAG TPA: alpha/beta fold hydrolase [Steroidobacteraceae bacterium]|nr:alpha/beta fold hydrolase [Steroidobacteraceae bacterium]